MSILSIMIFAACDGAKQEKKEEPSKDKDFIIQTEQFADFKVLRYQIPDFEELDLDKKLLIYHLYEAAHAGRDIVYDQNYRYNLFIRKTIEQILEHYKGGRSESSYLKFIEYAKCIFASNGIHHLYSGDKFIPEFSENYFTELIINSPDADFLSDMFDNQQQFLDFVKPIIFDPTIDARKIESDPNKDIILESATNFYHHQLRFNQVRDFYDKKTDKKDPRPVMHGLNSKLMIDENGELYEDVWKIGGMYTNAIEKIVVNLELALAYTENDNQRNALKKLIEFYKNGDLKTFDEYSILWVKDTDSYVDVVNGFIEVYDDPVGRRGAYQSMLSVRDSEASKRTQLISENAQWFEDNLPIHNNYKRQNAVGVDAKAINVVTVAGDNAPAPPIGVNLPNSNWIRAEYGSKSVTITNIYEAHIEASRGAGSIDEFAYTEDEAERAKKYGLSVGTLHTDLHEIIGHGSGQLRRGVADPASTLKNYYSPIEEARADLVGLYFLLDPKMVELGLMEDLDAGKTQYESYIRNGLLTQLVRIRPGANIEQAHMRARKLISEWAFEKGQKDNVIERIHEDGKTYFVVNDHEKLRKIFGELLKEIQRIKSEGDYNAARRMIENYAVTVDQKLHQEVLDRWEKLNIAPYTVFINPVLVPVYQDDKIIDIVIQYPDDFLQQMLFYGKNYSFLPVIN